MSYYLPNDLGFIGFGASSDQLLLQWSPIQLQMANQQKILPMGRLQGVTVDIDSVSTQTDFEVIEIVDNSNPYPTLLGIDWATDMKGIIN